MKAIELGSVLISLTTRKSIHASVVQWMLQQPYPKDIVLSGMPLEHARNQQVARFLASPYERIFILDSDCVPTSNTIEALLALDLPFVAAPHPAVKGREVGVMVLDGTPQNYKQHTPFNTGLQRCDVVGCAGMMIHRDVFSKISQPYFEFIYNEQGLLIQGEDFNFCEKIREAGVEVYAHCDYIQTHYVEVSV